jgi:hypothetical protein
MLIAVPLPLVIISRRDLAMDVLEHWQPQIDWTLFEQGCISPDVWDSFRKLILLCHAFKYWNNAARSFRPSRPYFEESTYGRRKRKAADELQRKQLIGHKYRAAFLAAGMIYKIADLVQAREGTADWTLSLALFNSVSEIIDTLQGHERADFSVLAFEQFDVTTEINGGPSEIAKVWKDRAYRTN